MKTQQLKAFVLLSYVFCGQQYTILEVLPWTGKVFFFIFCIVVEPHMSLSTVQNILMSSLQVSGIFVHFIQFWVSWTYFNESL
jgi:hypothetical protein